MNKIALITGASTGIGRELAVEFAKDNVDVILVARSAQKLKELALFLEKTYSINSWIFIKDLSTPSSATELFNDIIANGLCVDYLVNNAGFGDYKLFVDSNLQKQEDMINLNVLTLTKLTHHFTNEMKKVGSGFIMNVASTASFQPGPTMSVYFATKHYVLAFTEAIAEELKPFNIKVSALCPGPTESEFGRASGFKLIENAKKNNLPTSADVAKFAYAKMKKGKTVYVHGFWNRIQANLVRFVPRNWVTKITYMKLKEN